MHAFQTTEARYAHFSTRTTGSSPCKWHRRARALIAGDTSQLLDTFCVASKVSSIFYMPCGRMSHTGTFR